MAVTGDADIASLAALLSDRARARMLGALGDGRALPASLLAAEACVSASTASEHLRKLLDAGLVTVHPQAEVAVPTLRMDGDQSRVEQLAQMLGRR